MHHSHKHSRTKTSASRLHTHERSLLYEQPHLHTRKLIPHTKVTRILRAHALTHIQLPGNKHTYIHTQGEGESDTLNYKPRIFHPFSLLRRLRATRHSHTHSSPHEVCMACHSTNHPHSALMAFVPLAKTITISEIIQPPRTTPPTIHVGGRRVRNTCE